MSRHSVTREIVRTLDKREQTIRREISDISATVAVASYPEATHSGLNFGYGSGRVRQGTTVSDTAAATVALADATTNYIEVNPTNGTVSANAVGFTANRIPLFTVVTAGGAITTVTDRRSFLMDPAAAVAAHDLGGASHNADTLASLNAKISDADLQAKALTISEQTDASYTLVLANDGELVDMNRATAQTLTVPPNSSVAFPTGAQVLVRQKGAGQVTIAAGVGVTLQSADGELKTRVQHSVAGLAKVATDTWVVFGDLTA